MKSVILIVLGILLVIFLTYTVMAIKHARMYKNIDKRVGKITWVFIGASILLLLAIIYVVTTIEWELF